MRHERKSWGLFLEDVFLFPRFENCPAPDRLWVICFLIRAIIQLYCPPEPGQSWWQSDKLQFSSSPVINVTPHHYFSFQGRKPFTLTAILLMLFEKKCFGFCILPQHRWSLMSPAHYPRWAAPAPAPCQIDTIYGRMLIGTTRLFVNGAFCINQLTVGRGQQKLRKAMEISSKTSSKGRKSWMWKLMVKPGALWDVLERACEIICILTIHSQIQNVFFVKYFLSFKATFSFFFY